MVNGLFMSINITERVTKFIMINPNVKNIICSLSTIMSMNIYKGMSINIIIISINMSLSMDMSVNIHLFMTKNCP